MRSKINFPVGGDRERMPVSIFFYLFLLSSSALFITNTIFSILETSHHCNGHFEEGCRFSEQGVWA